MRQNGQPVAHHGRGPVPTAAYDEIADWYEQEFLANQQANDGMADPIPWASTTPCASCSATAAAPAWRSAAAPASTPPRSASWAGPPSGSTCPRGCCATREAALLPRKPMPNSYRSAAAGAARRHRGDGPHRHAWLPGGAG